MTDPSVEKAGQASRTANNSGGVLSPVGVSPGFTTGGYQPSEQLDPVQQAYQRQYWTVRLILIAIVLAALALWQML